MPVDREVEAAPEIRTDGDVTIIPVVEERIIVAKQLVLKEEIHIRRRRSVETVQIPVSLRRQQGVVTRRRTTRRKNDGDYSNRTLTAFFDDRASADAAVARLRQIGIGDASVRVAGGDEYAGRDYREEKGFWESVSDFLFPPERTPPPMPRVSGAGDTW